MRLSATFVPLLAALLALGSPTTDDGLTKRDTAGISSSVYNNLVWNFQYASAAYLAYDFGCPNPNGNTLITYLYDSGTDTQGYVARDDNLKQVVAVFRGSVSPTNFLTDAELILTDFDSPGVNPPSGTQVHYGFLTAYNSVVDQVLSAVQSVLDDFPNYTIVTSGHSLGGALSSLAAISLQQNFPDSEVIMYTYGQPRTGNPAYASFVNDKIGKSKIFRSTHTTDGVPTIIPQSLGYEHHATEFWQSPDPASASTTTQCNSSGEDPECSDSIPSEGIDVAHVTYYGILAATPYCS